MILGVDGGGTRCRLALDGPAGRHDIEVGPANVFTDLEGAMAQVAAGVEALAAAAGTTPGSLYRLPAYLGLAGVTDDQVARSVADALPFSQARVSDDRRIALRGALGRRDGVLAHFGTGSFLACQAGGNVRLAGGWGWQLGDEGSAYWVARSALSATLDAFDGLRAPSDLTSSLLHRFGSPGEIVSFCGASKPGDVAALSPAICEAARNGDPVGRSILELGAAHIETVVASFGWRDGMVLCLTGGMGPQYRDYLSEGLLGALAPAASDPIDGALDLARELALEGAQ